VTDRRSVMPQGGGSSPDRRRGRVLVSQQPRERLLQSVV
jgi:hypothetical protein